MPPRLRPLLALLLSGALALALAACGGTESASSDTDVNQLLAETFSPENRVESGRLDLAVKLDVQGIEGEAAEAFAGPASVRLSGPFESQGERRMPKFKLDLAFEGGGQRFRAGATSTGDKGYVSFQGRDYVASDAIFRQFRAGVEEAQSQEKGSQSLASLGIDPRRWLREARNEGEARVGDVDTVKITGGVDVPRMLDDLNRALQKAGQLGLKGSGTTPEQLTEEQRRQVTAAVKDPRVEIYTGADDRLLRRLVVTLGVQDPEGKEPGRAAVRLDLTLTGLNSDQEITPPANPRPLEELLGNLGALGGGLGGLGAGAGAPGAGNGANEARLRKYTRCVERAGSDADASRRCADLLTP